MFKIYKDLIFFNSTRGDFNTTHHFITSFSYVGTCGGTLVNVKNQTLGMFLLFFVSLIYMYEGIKILLKMQLFSKLGKLPQIPYPLISLLRPSKEISSIEMQQFCVNGG